MKRNLHKIVSLLVVFLLSVISLWAANIPTGTKLYLKPNDNWKTDGARFAAYFFYKKNNKTYDAWASMQATDCSGVYEVTAPKRNSQNVNYTTVIFCRMNPANATNDWPQKMNQTGDLVWDGTNSLFVLNKDSWDAGVWVKYGEYYVAGDGAGNSPWCNGKDWDAAGSKLDANGAVTFSGVKAGTYNFKITHGNWEANSYGFGNLDVENSTKDDCRFKDLGEGNGGNVKFTVLDEADITIKFNCNITTVTAKFANPIVENYVLMGIDNDWTNGIALQDNPNTSNENELMCLGQIFADNNDYVKVVKKTPCGDTFYAEVDASSSVPYLGGGKDEYASNIALEDGVYDFYFDKSTGKIRIEGNLDNSKKVYLDPQVYDKQNAGTWMSDGARIAVYCYQSEGDKNLWVTAASCGSYYYAQIPAMYDMYIWCRMDPAKENNWDSDWNQTSDIQYDAENTLTKLTGWADNDSKVLHYQTKYTGICGVNYDDCVFPAITGDTVYVHINKFVENDPCNYVFNSFEQAFAVLKTNSAICSATSDIYGSLRQDVITLLKPVVMLVHYGPEYYRGTEKVGMSGGHINDAPAIFFRNINPNGGKSLVVRTAEPKGNRSVLVHPVIRRSTNIVLDNLDIISDKDLRDNALDIDTGKGDETLEYTDGADKNFNIVPLPTIDSHITLKNCHVESYGRNGIHVVGIKGLLVENNEFYTKYDFTDASVSVEEKYDVVDWGGTIKFINCTDVKFLRNNSEGTLATSFFIQGCQRMLIMNNVFWNDNKVEVPGLNGKDRTVANVRLINYVDNPNIEKAKDFPVKNIGVFYNTFFIRSNDSQSATDSYVRFDFFRLGGFKQPVIEDNVGNKYFDPNTIRFQYNNCYSYDEDIEGNNDTYDNEHKLTFYLQGIGRSTDWCQCFKYNNFWSQYDETNNKSSSGFEIGKFCTGDDETYNLYLNVANQVCKTNPTNPSALVVVTDSLNIGTVISEDEDVSLQGASTFFNDRYNPDNGENAIRPKMSVDNSNEALSPYDKIYNEPGTINLYTSPIVGSQTTDVMLTSIKLSPNKKISLSIVDELDNPYPSDPVRFSITNAQGTPITSVITDNEGGLNNEPIYVTFVRPTDVPSNIEYVTYEAFLKIVPTQTEDAHLVLRIPLRGHYKTKLEKIGGAWTLGAYQQRAAQPLDTIVWHGTSSTDWDDRSNWYRPDGKLVTCLDALTKNLTVIIPKKNSESFVTPPEGITQYPSLPTIKALDDFRDARTAKWNGEQVNAGANTDPSTTMVAHKIYMEYGASLVGVEELNYKGAERYAEVEQEFIARRNTWLLAGAVVRPWLTDDEGNILVEDGKKQTRLACSRDYYRWHVPQVYMHQALIDEQTGDATWGVEFPDLDVNLPSDSAYAIHIPNEYGAYYLPASSYNYTYGTNYDPTEPIRYTFTGRFYNEANLPSYDVEPQKPVMLSNTYPANIDAQKIVDSGKGKVFIYNYDIASFVAVEGDIQNPVIQAQHGFVYTSAGGKKLDIEKEWLLNTEVTHRSAEVEMPYARIEMRNMANKVASNVYIAIDPAKDDVPNYAVDAPKVFAAETYALADLYVMRYDAKWASVRVPYANQPIPLGVKARQTDKTYTFGLVGTNMAGQLLLEDRLAGTVTDLSVNTYSVSDLTVDNKGVCEGRFYLQFVPSQTEEDVPTNIEEAVMDDHQIAIYACHNNVTISTNLGNNLQTVIVSDMVGRYQVYKVSGRYVTLSLPVAAGVYTVRVVADNAVRTEKVYLCK